MPVWFNMDDGGNVASAKTAIFNWFATNFHTYAKRFCTIAAENTVLNSAAFCNTLVQPSILMVRPTQDLMWKRDNLPLLIVAPKTELQNWEECPRSQ